MSTVRVKGHFKDTMPGMVSMVLEAPDADNSTHTLIWVGHSSVTPDLWIPGDGSISMVALAAVITGDGNLVEICFPTLERQEDPMGFRELLSKFIGAQAANVIRHGGEPTEIYVNERERLFWRRAHVLAVTNQIAWDELLNG